MQVIKRDGRKEPITRGKLLSTVKRACRGLSDVHPEVIAEEAHRQLFDGAKTSDVDRALVLAARAAIAFEPNYSYVAARLLLVSLYKEAFGQGFAQDNLDGLYRQAFVDNLKALMVAERISPRLEADFDLVKIAAALKPERDLLFRYLGVQTLYDRYFLHLDGRRLETPQAFWMRVAMGLALNEENPTHWAIEFYEIFSTLRSCPSSPTLFNSGTCHSQLSSCFLSTIEDSLDGIFGGIHKQARLSKYAGGLAVDWTPVRGTGAFIRGTNGPSQGIVPWLKVYNDMLVGVNQGSRRKGAGVAYLEPWHWDYEEFLELRKNTGDDRRRCHDMNTASWIPDLFMQRVEKGESWSFFSPDEVSDLHDLHGEDFAQRYAHYEEMGRAGLLRKYRQTPAKDLWRKMLMALAETGHPWMTWKDPANRRYPNKHVGIIHNSNLCVEVVEHSKPTKYKDGAVIELGETAVCTLASLNLFAHLLSDGIPDWGKIAHTVKTHIRALDNAVDLNFYPIPEAEKSSKAHRHIGYGLMGWADFLHANRLPIDSAEAISWADRIQEFIAHAATLASIQLAQERGAYPSYQGSLWSQGLLPIDTSLRGSNGWMDWEPVRTLMADHGVRNCTLLAIAPTACVTGETILLTSDGLLPITSFDRKPGEQWQDVDFGVAQEDGMASATKFYRNGKRDVVRIVTKRGHSISCTGNHRLRVIDDDGAYVWKEAGEIVEGDILVRKIGGHQEVLGEKQYVTLLLDQTPLHYNEKRFDCPTILDEPLAEMLGYYCGDGYVRDRDIGLVVCDDDYDLIGHWRDYFSSMGLTPSVEPRSGQSVSVVHIFSKRLERWFGVNGFRKPEGNHGEGAEGAFIPDAVLRSKSSVLCAFLRGLFEAEGTVFIQRSGTPTLEMSTVSELLAKTVHIALESLGIRATLVRARPGTFGYRPVWRVRPSNVAAVRKFERMIGLISQRKREALALGCQRLCYAHRGQSIKHKKLVDEFAHRVYQIATNKQLRLDVASRKNHGAINLQYARTLVEDNDYLADTGLARMAMSQSLDFVAVKSVCGIGEHETYDISVPWKNTYIANGFVSHNTIASIDGCSECISPDFGVLYVYSTLSGNFLMFNPHFVNRLKELGLWTTDLAGHIQQLDGDISSTDLPEEVKREYKTAFQVDQHRLIDAAAARQKWVDQSQSLNLFVNTKSLKRLSEMYFYAWKNDLKTTYYLHTKAASRVEKSVGGGRPTECKLGEACEACQ